MPPAGNRRVDRAAAAISQVFLLLIFLSALVSAQEKGTEWSDLASRAKAEGKVVVSGVPDPVVRRELPGRFTARFGIPVEYIGSRSSELAARLRSERSAGVYTVDVVISGSGTAASVFYPEKMLEPLAPLLLPEILQPAGWKGGKPWFFDPEGRYILRGFYYASAMDLAVNTRSVRPEEIRSIQDLLHPRWKGKISAGDPTVQGFGATNAAILYLVLGEDFFKRLYLDQQMALGRNTRQVSDWLAQGTYPVSLGVSVNNLKRLKEDGFPVEAILELSGQPVYSGCAQSLVSMFNKAPHPNAARLFVNWLVSREGLETYSRAYLEPTTRRDVDESFLPSHRIPKNGVSYLDTCSWDYMVNQEHKALRQVEQILKRTASP